MTYKFDFSGKSAAQDMIRIIMSELGCSEEEAIQYAISLEALREVTFKHIARVAYRLWGTSDPKRKWQKLNNPIISVYLDSKQDFMLELISKGEHVSETTAVCFFLVHTMGLMGYQI